MSAPRPVFPVIETLEELSALPDGAVVRSQNTGILVRIAYRGGLN